MQLCCTLNKGKPIFSYEEPTDRPYNEGTSVCLLPSGLSWPVSKQTHHQYISQGSGYFALHKLELVSVASTWEAAATAAYVLFGRNHFVARLRAGVLLLSLPLLEAATSASQLQHLGTLATFSVPGHSRWRWWSPSCHTHDESCLQWIHMWPKHSRWNTVLDQPHDPSDAGSNPAEVVEFLRTEKFREQVLREGL
jgi:hypothetical protein